MSAAVPASAAPVVFTAEQLTGLARLLGVDRVAPYDPAVPGIGGWMLDDDYVASDAQLFCVLLAAVWALGYAVSTSDTGIMLTKFNVTRGSHFGNGHAAYRLAMAALQLPEVCR